MFFSFFLFKNLLKIPPHHHPFRAVPLSVSLSCGVGKKPQTPWAQMTKTSEGESRDWICFPTVSPVVWLFLLFSVAFTLCSAVPLLSARSHTQPALDLKRNIGSSLLSQVGQQSSEKVLSYSWMDTFVYWMSPWRMVFVVLKPSLYVHK